jgi:hypothetical protein
LSGLLTGGATLDSVDHRMTTRMFFALCFFAGPGFAVEVTEPQAGAHGYPAMLDLNGKKLANGDFVQWDESDRLHVRISYKFKDDHRIEENAVFKQKPELAQEQWSWNERTNGQLVREYKVDFLGKKATAQKSEDGAMKDWSKQIEVEPGRTFAGFGFALALQNLRPRLLKGEEIDLQAIGFNPKPRVVTVHLSYHGVDEMKMSGRMLKGDHFTIRPKLPAVAKLFVRVPDTQIWLTTPPPAGFLRWEGPIAEPNEPVVRVDLVSGEESGAASPVKADKR